MRWSRSVLAFVWIAVGSRALSQTPQPPQAPPVGGELEQRIATLTEEVARLHARLDATEGTVDDPTNGPTLSLKGFGHVQAGIERTDSENDALDKTVDGFTLGGLDLFINSQVSDWISFMTETQFRQTSSGESLIEIERLILTYDINDHFNVQVGRFHTTAGYWNEAYHHGEWLQTTIGRPITLTSGLLPVHLVGLVLKADQESAVADLDYTLEVGNGRAPTAEATQTVGDPNEMKGINLALGVRPAAIDGLRFGANAWFDRIPENTTASSKGPAHGSIDERVVGAFVTYIAFPWEMIAEGFNNRHGGHGPSSTSNGCYLQLARRFGDFTPYLRGDLVALDDGDGYYASRDDRKALSLGLRWEVSDWNALKLQFTWTRINGANGGADSNVPSVTLQTCFVF